MVQVPLSLALVCIGSASWGVYTPQVEALGTPQQQAAFLGPLSSAWSGPQQQSVFCSRQQQQQQQQQLAAARRPFVGGNWKCNGTIQGAEDIVKMLNDAPPEVDDVEVVVAPPSLHAGFVLRSLRRPFGVGLQDSSTVKGFGAYTGELSPQMLKAYSAALSASDWAHVVLAYEPIWAIGTGQTATPEVAQNTHQEIRKWLRQHVSDAAAEEVRIIYGGSVKGANAKDLFAQPDIDGFLVGGASLTADFHAILKGAQNNKTSP